MAIGRNFYGDGDEINNLFRSQANQSINAGYNAADLADPFRGERKGYQNSLRSLMANPGEFSSSPVYKFAYDQGLNALQRKGSIRSGNKLAELMKYGQGMASQMYFPQANLLSNLAMSGSNPGAAAAAVSGAFNRSQDQRQMGTAAGMYGGGGGAKASGGGGVPWYMQGMPGLDPSAGTMGGGSLPTGGASGGFGGGYGYTPSYDYGGMGGGYTPSSAAGTGFMTSDYGTTNFGGYDGGYDGGYSPSYSSSYDPYGLSGYSDYGDYSGYGFGDE
jgi:hypothetical protein